MQPSCRTNLLDTLILYSSFQIHPELITMTTTMPKVTSVVMAAVVGLAMVSLVAGISGTATFYTPPYTRMFSIFSSLSTMHPLGTRT